MKKLVLLVAFIFLMGCQSRNDQVDLTSLGPITLTEAYPGSILNVDKVELMDGSSGDIRRIEDRKVIQQWIAQIKDLELLPDDNQEGLVGSIRYSIV